MPGTHFSQVIAAVLGTMLALLLPTSSALGQEATPSTDAEDRYFGALPWEEPEDAERMVVERITDGDTLRLAYPGDDWYYNTRLIGIQAPEMDGPYTDEECYGPEAQEFLIDLLPVGTEVVVQQDITDEDRNGRRLRHVFVIDSDTEQLYLVSEVLVLGGFADARSYPPDDLYDDVLAGAEEIARDEDAGLWDACAA